MDELFKQASIQQLVKYNKHLLLVTYCWQLLVYLQQLKLLVKKRNGY